MLWQPMQSCAFMPPALRSPAFASCACARPPKANRPARAHAASIEAAVGFMVARIFRSPAFDYRVDRILPRPFPRALSHEVPRLADLRRHARPDARGERGRDAQAAAAREGRTRH